MSQKVHYSIGKVPFSWEKKPGVSKGKSVNDGFNTYPSDCENGRTKQLSPPPSRSDIFRAGYAHDVQLLPLPPNRFLPPHESSSKKVIKQQDDPFFTAYMECTKISKDAIFNDCPNSYPTDSEYDQTQQLFQPPSWPKIVKGVHVHDAQPIPLPPSEYLPLQKRAPKKGLKKQDNSLFGAYRECTNGNRGKSIGNSKDDGVGFGISKNMSIFSCKASCSVRDDDMVFMISKSRKKKGEKFIN